jgi:uncharacterized surface protein with fasciclin (FAS1) repeats
MQTEKQFKVRRRVMKKFFKSAILTVALFSLSVSGFAGAKGDIVDTAVSAGQFNTLVAAVKAAGLVDVLKGDGPFTVFAPNDEAFAKLPKGTVESLLQDKEKLTAILTYHVVPGNYRASDVLGKSSLKTVQGQSISVKKSYGNVMVDQAKVIATDIETSNGTIHVIDSVILPK